MTHDESLLNAVIESPDDDAPRLAYADWLDGHGESARAHFIRVQIELAHLPDGDPRRAKLEAKEQDSLKEHRATWLRPLRDRPAGPAHQFRRGFLEEIAVSAADFVRQGESLLRLAPVRKVWLRRARGRMRQLAGCPSLARLTDLGFWF